MILPDKKIKEENMVHLYDYEARCPKGMQKFHAMIWFDDMSHTLWSGIFAKNRQDAYDQVIARFADCFEYVSDISVNSSDNL